MKFICKILLVIPVLFSCGKKVYLSEEERSWNPYQENEILVFKCSNGIIDSLVITELNDNVFPAAPGPLEYYEQSIWVYSKQESILNRNPHSKILEISASTPDKPSEITFLLSFENAKFAGWGNEIKELSKYPQQTITTEAGTFRDVIEIDPVVLSHREESIVKLYWSIKHGYIKYQRKDGLSWELSKKYIP